MDVVRLFFEASAICLDKKDLSNISNSNGGYVNKCDAVFTSIFVFNHHHIIFFSKRKYWYECIRGLICNIEIPLKDDFTIRKYFETSSIFLSHICWNDYDFDYCSLPISDLRIWKSCLLKDDMIIYVEVAIFLTKALSCDNSSSIKSDLHQVRLAIILKFHGWANKWRKRLWRKVFRVKDIVVRRVEKVAQNFATWPLAFETLN